MLEIALNVLLQFYIEMTILINIEADMQNIRNSMVSESTAIDVTINNSDSGRGSSSGSSFM